MATEKTSLSSLLGIGAAAIIGFGAIALILSQKADQPISETLRSANAPVKLAETSANSTAPAQAAKTASAAAPAAAVNRSEIETIVREYLVANPEILIEMQRELERKMELAQAERTKQAVAENREDLFGGPTSINVGAEKGKVTLVEFFDYNCGFCKRAIGQLEQIRSENKDVRIIMKEMPIFGPDSEGAARVAIAARQQGKYWELHRALLQSSGQVTFASAMRIAEGLGLDMDRLKKDAASQDTVNVIRKTQELGRKLGIQGTPHFFVNDQMIAGAPQDLYRQLKELIKKARG